MSANIPPFEENVQTALRRARELSGLSPEDYAATLSATLAERITPRMVLAWERGKASCDARTYFAACRVADQPQSSVVGEMDLVPEIYELERVLSDIAAKVGISLPGEEDDVALQPRSAWLVCGRCMAELN